MKVVKGGTEEKKGESKKDSLVKSRHVYVMFMFMFSHGHGYGGWKVRAHVKSYQVKGREVWHLIKGEVERSQVLISRIKMVPPGFDPGTLTTSR